MRSGSSSIVWRRRTAGPRDERTGRWRARRGYDNGGERAGRQALAKLSVSAKEIGMRQRASMRVKQSKSQQIVANADAGASGYGLKTADSHQDLRQLTMICRQVMRSPNYEPHSPTLWGH
jgi:hypothetical protein